MQKADLTGAKLIRTDLRGADLRGATVVDARGIVLTGKDLEEYLTQCTSALLDENTKF